MRPKNVILLEIMILVTNFNDVDLLYYLLLDAFAQRRRVWCTMVAMERRRPPAVHRKKKPGHSLGIRTYGSGMAGSWLDVLFFPV
jgi:hypothetical protein